MEQQKRIILFVKLLIKNIQEITDNEYLGMLKNKNGNFEHLTISKILNEIKEIEENLYE